MPDEYDFILFESFPKIMKKKKGRNVCIIYFMHDSKTLLSSKITKELYSRVEIEGNKFEPKIVNGKKYNIYIFNLMSYTPIHYKI